MRIAALAIISRPACGPRRLCFWRPDCLPRPPSRRRSTPELQSPSGIPEHRRSGAALTRDLRRDRKSADPSALHELPSRRRSAAAGRRSSDPLSAGPPARPHVGDACTACHTDRNFTLPTRSDIPEHPQAIRAGSSRRCRWRGKASRSARFAGSSRTRTRNGGRDLALLQEHIAKDDLVAWGWNPGAGREPAPGSQELAGRTGRRPGSTAARNARELLRDRAWRPSSPATSSRRSGRNRRSRAAARATRRSRRARR